MPSRSEPSFGEKLRRLRQAAGWSQEELAERAGLTAAAVGSLERGERRHPYPQTLRALADALELEAEDRAALFSSVPRRGESGEGDAVDELEGLDDEAHEAHEAIRPPSAMAGREAEAAPLPGRPTWARALPWALALVLLGWLGWLALRGPGPEVSGAPPPMVWTLPPPAGAAFVTTSGPPALSPDERRLIFVARSVEGPRQLWMRPLAVAESRPLPGTEGASFPFWSPDGRRVGFFADDQIKQIDISNGSTKTLASLEDALGGTWSADGTLLAAGNSGRALVRISPSGEVTDVVPGQELGDVYLAPWFLPEGEHYLVTLLSVTSGRPEGVYLANLRTGEARRLLSAVSNAQYAAPGHLVFWHQHALRALPFDLDRLEVGGAPALLEDGVQFASFDASAYFAVGEHLLVHLPGGITGPGELAWFDRSGGRLGALGETADYFRPRLSPDGRRLAVDISEAFQPTGDIWIFDAARGAARRLTSDPQNESSPLWSPDGEEIIYCKGTSICRRSVSGAGEEILVLEDTEPVRPTDWSSDGRWVLFSKGPVEGADLWVLDLESHQATPWLTSPFHEDNARLSPDGHWVAYTSDETGRYEVYVEDFPGRRQKHAISLGEGWGPAWSRDGGELFFYAPGRGLMSVKTRLGPELIVDKPQTLFAVEIQSIDGEAYFDVTADAQRFLINRLVEQTTTEPLVVRTSWSETLGDSLESEVRAP